MTPQPPPPVGPPNQSFLSKHWPWLVGAGCLLFACCGVGSMLFLGVAASQLEGDGTVPVADGPRPDRSSSSARVDCGTPGPDGVACTIQRTGGAAAMDACWTLEITCVNGGVMTGEACGELAAGARTSSITMPVASFSNQEACDSPSAGAVKDLVVTEK